MPKKFGNNSLEPTTGGLDEAVCNGNNEGGTSGTSGTSEVKSNR